MTPSFSPSTDMENQMQTYNLYTTVGLVVGIMLIMGLLTCLRKFIYIYIFLMFGFLLGFSFYLLKSIDNQQQTLITAGYQSGSYLLTSQTSITGLAYTLLGGYLLLFPIVLFAPKRIKTLVLLLS